MNLNGFFGHSSHSKILLFTITAFSIGVIVIAAQRTEVSVEKDENGADMSLTTQPGHFRKTSSTASLVDRGNRIAAVRRLTLLVDDVDATGERIKRGIPHIEIELYSAIAPPVLNSHYVVRIGSREFYPGGRGCSSNGHCTMVVMSPEEFESLSDRAIVSMRNGVRARAEDLARLLENGEPTTVVGSKFGRLDKGMIDRFPAVERLAVEP
ncbi:MAG: hypothetical protein ABIO91_07045 [Pyrinomonadaceae bacterium]